STTEPPDFTEPPNTSEPPTTIFPSNTTELCNGEPFDAFTQTSKYLTTAFRGNQVYEIGTDGVKEGFPKNIGKLWREAPTSIDAAVTISIKHKKTTYLIKGERVWRYGHYRLLADNETTRDIWPEAPLQISAAFALPDRGGESDLLYLLEDCRCHVYTVRGGVFIKIDVVYICDLLPRVDAIDAAVAIHRRLFIFHHNVYYRVRVRNRSNFSLYPVPPVYPRPISLYWLGCPPQELF
uniref:Uncharacterized protein n=1 Tax=Ciona savignyi TaxID=51511 RepID=H2YRG3_CIOSA